MPEVYAQVAEGGWVGVAVHTAISLCTGVGMLDHGIGLAYRLTGRELVPLLYVEKEAFRAANLVWQMEQGFLAPAPVWSDAQSVTGDECRSAMFGARHSDLGLIFGGIPCQPWSQAGKRDGHDDERDLWPATTRAIEVYRPSVVFIENVSGIARANEPAGGGARVVRDLERMGYRATFGFFSSEECGASHGRLRCFIMGYAKDYDARRSDGFSPDQPGREESIRPGRNTSGTLALEDTESKRSGAQRQNGDRTRIPRGCDRASDELADSGRRMGRDSRETPTGKSRDGRKARIEPEHDHRAERGEQAMADASSSRRRETELDVLPGRKQPDTTGLDVGLPRYAPGQTDYELWATVADTRPDLLPAHGRTKAQCELQRVAHGLADRAHRLSATGDGVDPMVAALAYLTLEACLE